MRDRCTPQALIYSKANKTQMNQSEVRMWMILRRSEFNFRRQYPIGAYICDFASLTHRIVIEVDGVSHESSESYDLARDMYLIQAGYRILRIRGHIPYPDTHVFDGAWTVIRAFISSPDTRRVVYWG